MSAGVAYGLTLSNKVPFEIVTNEKNKLKNEEHNGF